MIDIRTSLKPQDLSSKLDRMWALSGEKIKSIDKGWSPEKARPYSP
jgi:hypothetical protein